MTISEQIEPIDGVSTPARKVHGLVVEPDLGGDTELFHRRAETWRQAIEDWTVWLDGAGCRPTTLRQRRWQLRTLMDAYYATKSPWKLTTTDLITWYTSQNWGPQTRYSACSALRSFYDWAVKVGHTKKNPAEGLPKIRVNRGLPRPVAEPALKRALADADDRVRLMLLLAAYGGLRDHEIGGLRWSDITDTHVIVTGKGERTRQIWMHPVLKAEIEAEQARREAGGIGSGFRYKRHAASFVFPGQHGGLSPSRVCEIVSDALGDGLTSHQLRHRFATRVLDKTGNLAAVQELLGHANANTTRIYTKVSDGVLRDAVNSI